MPAKKSQTTNANAGNWENNMLSYAFFSKENIQILQNGIRAGVYNKSGGTYLISAQNQDTVRLYI